MAVSKRLRFEILRRDNHQCRYCGATAPDATLTVDHVIPEALGGSDDPANLVAACAECNAGKSATPPDAALVADVAADAERWAGAIKVAAAQRRDKEVELSRWFTKTWYVAADTLLIAFNKEGRRIIGKGSARMYLEIHEFPQVFTLKAPHRPPEYLTSVQNFLAAGLEREDIERLVATAMASSAHRDDKWRYFCGCCWRVIREIQEAAAAALEGSEVSSE
jgi:hypothetical protein